MEVILTGTIGLITGSIMYYVTKLFFDPIVRYKNTIFEIDKNLIYYANVKYYTTDLEGNPDRSDTPYNQQLREGKDTHRKSAGMLRAAYCHLPKLYKKYLSCSNVNPFAASRDLIGLSNTLELPTDLRYEREDRIRKHLRLFDPETGEQMYFKEGER